MNIRLNNHLKLLSLLLLALAGSFWAAPSGADGKIIPYPDAMTGKTAPDFALQGIYGEIYTRSTFAGAPVALIFGTSW